MYTLEEALLLPKLFKEANKKTQYFRYPNQVTNNGCNYCEYASAYQYGIVRYCLFGGFGIPASYKAVCDEFKKRKP